MCLTVQTANTCSIVPSAVNSLQSRGRTITPISLKLKKTVIRFIPAAFAEK